MTPTRKERRAKGKALRDKCAKDAHANWKPHSKQRVPIELLTAEPSDEKHSE